MNFGSNLNTKEQLVDFCNFMKNGANTKDILDYCLINQEVWSKYVTFCNIITNNAIAVRKQHPELSQQPQQ